MIFRNAKADLFIPDQCNHTQAFTRITHLGIASHQDDLEIAAYHGITECFRREDKEFDGVVVTNGSRSPRKGSYANFTDEEMLDVRKHEQRKAAFVGENNIMVQLGYQSEQEKHINKADVTADILTILKQTQPRFVYLHNPATAMTRM